MTLLVLVPGRDPVLLVPELEWAAALAGPGATAVEVVGWSEGDDPYMTAAGLLSAGRLAISDQAGPRTCSACSGRRRTRRSRRSARRSRCSAR